MKGRSRRNAGPRGTQRGPVTSLPSHRPGDPSKAQISYSNAAAPRSNRSLVPQHALGSHAFQAPPGELSRKTRLPNHDVLREEVRKARRLSRFGAELSRPVVENMKGGLGRNAGPRGTQQGPTGKLFIEALGSLPSHAHAGASKTQTSYSNAAAPKRSRSPVSQHALGSQSAYQAPAAELSRKTQLCNHEVLREEVAKARRLSRYGSERSQPVVEVVETYAESSQQKADIDFSEATGIVGLCPDTCPEPERAERERNGNLDKHEWLDGDRNQTSKFLSVQKEMKGRSRRNAGPRGTQRGPVTSLPSHRPGDPSKAQISYSNAAAPRSKRSLVSQHALGSHSFQVPPGELSRKTRLPNHDVLREEVRKARRLSRFGAELSRPVVENMKGGLGRNAGPRGTQQGPTGKLFIEALGSLPSHAHAGASKTQTSYSNAAAPKRSRSPVSQHALGSQSSYQAPAAELSRKTQLCNHEVLREEVAKARRLSRFGSERSQPVVEVVETYAESSQQQADIDFSEATGIVGLCPDTCPEPERAERERNGNLDKHEWLSTKLSALSLAPSNTSAVPVISLACGDQKDTSTRGGEVVQAMKFENTEQLGENAKPSVLAVPDGHAKVPEEARADDEIPDNVAPAVKKRKHEKMEFFVEKLEPTIPDVPDVHADALEEARADDESLDNAAFPVKRRKTCEKMEDKVKKCMEFDKDKLRLPVRSVEDVLDTVFKKSRADDDRFNHLLDQCRKVQDEIAKLLFFYF